MSKVVDSLFIHTFAKEVYAKALKYETELESERKRSVIREKNKNIIYGLLNLLQTLCIRSFQVSILIVNICSVGFIIMTTIFVAVTHQCLVCQMFEEIHATPWYKAIDEPFWYRLLYSFMQVYTKCFTAEMLCPLMAEHNLTCVKRPMF